MTPPPGTATRPRLTRHVLHLERGNRVQVAVAGRGVPLVLVHGYTAEGFLYAQSLSRLVGSGFKVVAVDAAGHGGTEGLEEGGADLQYYAGLLGRVVDHLGIDRAVYAGHSMGGRLVTELAARQPRRALAVLLVDAIVGDTWDSMVQLWRLVPGLMGLTGAVFAVDTATTVPLLRDPRQAMKLGRLALPVALHNARRPRGLVGAAVSILRSGPTRWMLERLREAEVPVVAIHGDRDVAVPLRTGEDAARRAGGELVVVHGATHAWPLKDPETLPAIVGELLADGSLGDAVRSAVEEAGLDPDDADLDAVEAALCARGAMLLDLVPGPGAELAPEGLRDRPRRPRYAWTRTRPLPV